LVALIVCQLYRVIVVRFSIRLTALTAFDAVVVWLTWREYTAKRARGSTPGPGDRAGSGLAP
jgi:uncharacterized membrane protein